MLDVRPETTLNIFLHNDPFQDSPHALVVYYPILDGNEGLKIQCQQA